jgi:phosphatidylglycerol:prolipoprotein diacylglycerol transferase
MYPRLLQLDFFTLHSYGLLVALAFLAGLQVASKLAKRVGLDPEAVSSVGIYAAMAGIVGAKLFLVLNDFGYYRANPGQIFSLATLQAGGVFYGGFLVALAVAIWRMRHYGLAPLPVADIFAPAAALGHAIGRIGCFLAGCCWGKPTSVPWAVTFTDPAARDLVGVPLNVPLHPTQLYEAVALAVIFVILWRQFGRSHRPGAILGLYLVLYSSFRFGVEFLRDPSERAFPFGWVLSSTQWMAVGLVAVGVYLLAGRRKVPYPRGVLSPGG